MPMLCFQEYSRTDKRKHEGICFRTPNKFKGKMGVTLVAALSTASLCFIGFMGSSEFATEPSNEAVNIAREKLLGTLPDF